MKSIYLFALLVVLASANTAADITGDTFQRSNFICFASQQNVTLTILQIWDQSGTINKDFLKNYIYSRDAKIPDFDASVLVNDTFAAEDICNGVSKALPTSFNGTVWLNIQNKPGYWSRDVADRIDYLGELATVCKTHGLNTGIYSSADDWTTVMGSQGAGSDTLKAIPVWYYNDNGSADFEDFDYAGFGSWTKPGMKNYGASPYICMTYINSLNYYE